MAVVGIKRTRIILSIPEATHESVKILADRKGMTVSRYIKFLVDQEVRGVPLALFAYFCAYKSMPSETGHAKGQLHLNCRLRHGKQTKPAGLFHKVRRVC